MNDFGDKVSFIWQVADLLRGPYRPNQYKDIMLPMTVLRRLDCVLEPTKEAVLEELKRIEQSEIKTPDSFLEKASGQTFFNTSNFTFEKLKAEPNNIAPNLHHYINNFSKNVRDIFDQFGFGEQIKKLEEQGRLYLLVKKFCEIDLHPDKVSNIEMGYIFEELIRKFNEASNEEAGDHFTPRDVIRLMVDLLFMADAEALTRKGVVRSLYDPACGTGGMLTVAEEYLRELNQDAKLYMFGQDYNPQSFAVCGSDMLIKGQKVKNILFGNSFTQDKFEGKTFNYMLANPPFGVEWKPEEKFVRKEHEEQGFGGRFGPGLPRINDGSLLFLLHMISKMEKDEKEGTRLVIVFNGSPLFTGSAGSGESNIRQWIIENDLLEGVVAMPDQLFYNTGISTYLWIVTNRKQKQRKGKIQLINAPGFFKKMRKSLGNKRNEICEEQRKEIVQLYDGFQEGEFVKIFDNENFGYQRITVERPLKLNFAVTPERLQKLKESNAFINLAYSKKKKNQEEAQAEIEEGKKLQESILAVLQQLEDSGIGSVKNRNDFTKLLKSSFQEAGLEIQASLFKAIMAALSERDENAELCKDSKGNPEPDPELRDYENVPLSQSIEEYMEKEVLPHVPGAWVDASKTKTGYELNFNRYFYSYTPPRPLQEIEADLKTIESEIASLLTEVTP